MTQRGTDRGSWPDLPYSAWRETRETLHLWTQIVGKIRLSQTPWLNHSWHVALYVTARGLTTSPIPYGERAFQIDFDFIDHLLRIETSDGARRQLPLGAQSVADFHAAVMAALGRTRHPVAHQRDAERSARPDPRSARTGCMPPTMPSTHNASGGCSLQADRVFKAFRTGFLGKCSPVHFFWGSFDLAVTRFSGRRAPPHPGGVPNLADAVTREAYSHEVSSAGFWPGGGGDRHTRLSIPTPIPRRTGFRSARVRPEAAFFSQDLGEFILPYDAVRTAAAPDDDAAGLPAKHLRRRGRYRQMGSRHARMPAGKGGHATRDLVEPRPAASMTPCRSARRVRLFGWRTMKVYFWSVRPPKAAWPLPARRYRSNHGCQELRRSSAAVLAFAAEGRTLVAPMCEPAARRETRG